MLPSLSRLRPCVSTTLHFPLFIRRESAVEFAVSSIVISCCSKLKVQRQLVAKNRTKANSERAKYVHSEREQCKIKISKWISKITYDISRKEVGREIFILFFTPQKEVEEGNFFDFVGEIWAEGYSMVSGRVEFMRASNIRKQWWDIWRISDEIWEYENFYIRHQENQ